jgi:hypothetical protein
MGMKRSRCYLLGYALCELKPSACVHQHHLQHHQVSARIDHRHKAVVRTSSALRNASDCFILSSSAQEGSERRD